MRVVSLVPSWTETLFALGLTTDDVVGVTKYCVHPAAPVADVAKVGGTKDPDVASIVALAPDVVVANKEENRGEDVTALTDAGLDVLVTDVRTARDAAPETVRVGRAVGVEKAALDLASRIDSTIERVGNAARAAGPPVPVYVPIWRRPWMTLSADTFAHDVLRVAGARNVFGGIAGTEGVDRYPERDPAAAVAAGASAALLPSEPYPFTEKHVAETADAGFALDRVRLLDGEALTWYGVRMVEGLPQVAAAVAAVHGPPEGSAKGY